MITHQQLLKKNPADFTGKTLGQRRAERADVMITLKKKFADFTAKTGGQRRAERAEVKGTPKNYQQNLRTEAGEEDRLKNLLSFFFLFFSHSTNSSSSSSTSACTFSGLRFRGIGFSGTLSARGRFC